ncbi:hypothetical protein LTR08_002415 [Meristemomyces frigidus]|nr:hypothetical protein LTR08_002415 [Meristemomyces frigidus]
MAFRGGPPPAGAIYLDGQQPSLPDPLITAAENALVKVTRDRQFPIGIEGATVPGRRGYGTKGTAITLRSNYFTITTAFEGKTPEFEQTWYRYDVDMVPEPSKQKRRRVIVELLTHQKFCGIQWASDFVKLIVTTKPVDLGKGKEWVEKMSVPQESSGPSAAAGGQQTAPQGPPPAFVQQAQARNQVAVRITHTGVFNVRQLIEYLRSTLAGAEYAVSGDVIQLANIILCKPPNSNAFITNAGHNKYYPYEGHPGAEINDLGAGLEAIRGYYASVRPAVGRLLLNLNVTSGAFYKPMALPLLVREFGGRNKEQDETFLCRLKVRAVYKKDKDATPFMMKMKTIVGFAKENRTVTPQVLVMRFGDADQVKFQYTDASTPNAQPREISVNHYFRQHHGITLRQPKLPVLNVGARSDPQYLPQELCEVPPGQAYNRLLNSNQTTKMLSFAARYPNLNAVSIAGSVQNRGSAQKIFGLAAPGNAPTGNAQLNSVQPWGFRVGVDMISVPGRILANPKVNYATKQISPRFGSWNLAETKFTKPGKFTSWKFLVINRQGRNSLAQPEQISTQLGSALKQYGIQMGRQAPPSTILVNALNFDNRAANDGTLEQAFKQADEEGVRLLFCVLPEHDRWLYARLKYYGDVQFGIHTIGSIGSKLEKPGKGQLMYMGNLALKFNIKGGGVNHTVAGTFGKLGSNTMLMGIDVTHPSPGSKEGAPSIAAVVASIDEHLTQWPGSIRTQKGKEEMVAGLEAMVIERLNMWQKKNANRLPNNIIIYRDGVSEGQYDLVLRMEMPSFYAAFEKRYGNKKNWPKVAVIIVGKRHHTRFYPTRSQDADARSWNPLPGTIVDRHVTGRILREFFLQAHQGLQGTARPAHYVVIKDDVGFEADELEQFTHNMCYLFNRATKAVSICPPAYYADLLCERGRCYLHSTLQEDNGSAGSATGNGEDWSGGVHPRLEESTFYI